jgi:uncharacterized membrane-anchored protein
VTAASARYRKRIESARILLPRPSSETPNLSAALSYSRTDNRRSLWSKVPEITLYFWIVKILTTAMGEAASDYLVFHVNPMLAVIGGLIVLCLALIAQFAVRRYVAAVYWFLVMMVAIVGTMAADIVHIVLGVPYLLSTALFLAALGAIFVLWARTEHTVSIHSIVTRRRELFYWMTVSATFALGTAAGDMTAATLHLGYALSGILFLALFIAPAIGYWKFRLNGVIAFWFAYVTTRPLGASFADWAGKPADMGGLGYGTAAVSVVLTILIVGFVAYLSISRVDGEPRPERSAEA